MFEPQLSDFRSHVFKQARYNRNGVVMSSVYTHLTSHLEMLSTSCLGELLLFFHKSLQKKRNGLGQEAVTEVGDGGQRQPKKTKAENPTSSRHARRKEKLGERIAALQQLVSPFGKTDTASVLHEAMGYIRFLHDQVQVLCSPYLQSLPSSYHQHQHGDGGNNEGEVNKDLRSRGLCLIPVGYTVHVAGSNGADFWSSAAIAIGNNVSTSVKQ